VLRLTTVWQFFAVASIAGCVLGISLSISERLYFTIQKVMHQKLSEVWQELTDAYNDRLPQARTTSKQATTKRHVCSRRICLQPEPLSRLRNSTQHLQQKTAAKL
jgi:hypothetical protein